MLLCDDETEVFAAWRLDVQNNVDILSSATINKYNTQEWMQQCIE